MHPRSRCAPCCGSYWFTTLAEKRATGMWWNRQLIGLYAPVLELLPDGKAGVVQWPEPLPPHD